MARNFKELRDTLSPEARGRVDQRVAGAVRNLDMRCGWCDGPIIFHSGIRTRWHGWLCRRIGAKETYIHSSPIATAAVKPAYSGPVRSYLDTSGFGDHWNRLKFRGVLAYVDLPSDGAPSGARGHRIIVTRDSASAALSSLVMMGVNYSPRTNSHNVREKCGFITAAEIDGNELIVEGYLYGVDFPELLKGTDSLGMSFELKDAHIEDMHHPVWTLTRFTFTGAAIVPREKAAYRRTSFSLLDEVSA